MTPVLHLAAIIPGDRDPEETDRYVDSRFRPSFVDLGTLQTRACAMAAGYKTRGVAAYPDAYVGDLGKLIKTSVRHVQMVVFDRGGELVTFHTKDRWGDYTYSFSVKRSWFAKE